MQGFIGKDGKGDRFFGLGRDAELVREAKADLERLSSRRSIANSVGLFAPPPETIRSR